MIESLQHQNQVTRFDGALQYHQQKSDKETTRMMMKNYYGFMTQKTGYNMK